ncbi:MAG: Uracil permease, partial [uncultured Nocardioidaceae bacterium]
VDVQVDRRPRRQDATAGEVGRTRRAVVVGQDGGARRAARRRDVRRHLRLPADHGAEPAAGDHDERHRDDRVPPHRLREGPELPGDQRRVRRRRVRDLRAGRRPRRRDGSRPGGRRRARPGRCAHPLRRRRGPAPRAASGRHRRGRDAHRLQPRPGGGEHLLAAGPVDRAAHDGRGDPDGGGAARLPRPHRDPARADLRLRPLVGVRPVRHGELRTARPEPAGRGRQPLLAGGDLLRCHRLRPQQGQLGRREGGRLAGLPA